MDCSCILFLNGAVLSFGIHLYGYTEGATTGTQAIIEEISFDSMFFTNSLSHDRSILK